MFQGCSVQLRSRLGHGLFADRAMYFFQPVDELAQPFPFEPAQFRADLVDGRCYHSRVGRPVTAHLFAEGPDDVGGQTVIAGEGTCLLGQVLRNGGAGVSGHRAHEVRLTGDLVVDPGKRSRVVGELLEELGEGRRELRAAFRRGQSGRGCGEPYRARVGSRVLGVAGLGLTN